MGSLSLIIVLIVVVWVIVLAPMVMGNNKPIRRSGEGYEETRVLHTGDGAPVRGRLRPKLTRADVHRFDEAEDEHYEVVEPDEHSVLVDVRKDAEPEETTIDGEVVPEPETETEPSGGSTALSVLQAREQDTAEEESGEPYPLDETYLAPSDYGFDAPAAEEPVEQEPVEKQEEPADAADLTDEEIDFARARRGRGGWDPEREKHSKADRIKRRQRTLLGLIIADVVTFVAAFVAGGWVWVLPVITVGLTVWFMVVLRGVVRQERALHARRMRQLRRARMGAISADEGAPVPHYRRRPGAVIVEMDDESPDFHQLPYHREQQAPEPWEAPARAS